MRSANGFAAAVGEETFETVAGITRVTVVRVAAPGVTAI
jgi:hypothetical protein